MLSMGAYMNMRRKKVENVSGIKLHDNTKENNKQDVINIKNKKKF